MRWSQLYIPTLREDPADAEVPSHKLLVRAGYIRQLAAGIYSYLYLGQRSALKIMQIIREEMDRIGQELYLPALHPAELWKETGRWEQMAGILFRFKDHGERDMLLGPTHEEVMTALARADLRSYRQLPQIWYQIQVKFRDEARPKSGLMRLRQFIMKDSYSFDLDEAGLDVSYRKHYDAYCAIFDRCGLRYQVVEAHSGAMGGSQSHEFMVVSPAGEDRVVTCACGYAANLEKARAQAAPVEDLPGDNKPEVFATPNVKTIEELAAFTGVVPQHLMKSVAYAIPKESEAGKYEPPELVLALMRGDHEVSEAKLGDALGGAAFRPAHAEEIRSAFGADPGFLGPVGLKNVRILLDEALRGRRNLITGANQNDKHVRNVTPERDFAGQFADLRTVSDGDACPECGKPLRVSAAIEVGHIFKLGRRYAEAMGARVLDPQGKLVTLIMGSYGIGVERILTAAVEQNHDEKGMKLPRAIAPFQVVITPVNVQDATLRGIAEKLYAQLRAAGCEVLYDDRDERAGVKFNDAELVGIPLRLTVGRKAAEGQVELYNRSTGDRQDVSIQEAPGRVQTRSSS